MRCSDPMVASPASLLFIVQLPLSICFTLNTSMMPVENLFQIEVGLRLCKCVNWKEVEEFETQN